MSWDEPRPPAPRDHELTLGEWLTEIDEEYGWDHPGLVLLASEHGGCWNNGHPQRHLAVELFFKSDCEEPGYETTITSTHHHDDKECLHG